MLIDRNGHVTHVLVGDDHQLELPDLGRWGAGSGRLRGLRLVHFCGWLAARWHDPIFPQTWPQFETHTFWQETADALEEALDLAWAGPEAIVAATPVLQEEPELTNADLFWDWKG